MRDRHVIQLIRLVLALALVAVVLTQPSPPGAQAQIGGTIGYGSSVFGSITAVGQSLTYSFNGSIGDFVQITIRNWTGTLDPHLDLIAPDGQTVASSGANPLSEDPLEAFLPLFLPQAGIYSLQVRGERDTTGDFVLKLQGRSPVTATPLLYGQSLDVNIPTNPPPQYFSFDAQDCPTVLTVSNLSEGQPFTFPFAIKVYNPLGILIAQLYGGDAVEDRLILAAASGHYEVMVSSDDAQIQGTVRLLVTCTDQAPGCISGSLAGGQGADGGICPSCFGDDFGGEQCATFELVASLDGNTASFTWPAAEGAEWYIFGIIDASGAPLLDSPRLLEGETSTMYTFSPEDLERGPFTALVRAGSGTSGLLCVDDAPISFEGEATDQCSGIAVGVDVVPGAARAAVAHWSAAPGAAAYLLHIYAYGEDDSFIGIRVFTVPGDATTYHLADVFPSDYDRFHVRIGAYAEATGGGAFGDMPQGYLCDGSADFEFSPTGPMQWGPGVQP